MFVFINYTKRQSVATSASMMCSLFCCLTLLISSVTIKSHFWLPAASASSEAVSKPESPAAEMTPLKGELAASWLKQQGIYDSLRSSTEASRYQMLWAADAYQAINHAQKLRARFTTMGMSVTTSGKGRDWQLEMKLDGIGYGATLHHLAPGEIQTEGNRIEISKAAIDNPQFPLVKEWYINRADGLEQGFTIAERPAGYFSGARLALTLETRGELKASLQGDKRGIVLASEDGTQVLTYNGLHAYDAAGVVLNSELVLADNVVRLEVDDTEALFPLTIDPVFQQAAKLIAADGEEDDEFGSSVAVSGDTVVAGAPLNDVGANQNQGSAYVFRRNQGGPDQWGLVKQLTASDGSTNDVFGLSVSISGNTIVVGAGNHKVGANGFQGAAYIFERNQGGADNWGEVKQLVASDGSPGDAFGVSVSVSDDTIVVGAAGDKVGANFNQGSAYVFVRDHGGVGNWGEAKHLIASDGEASDLFGRSVSISGNTAIVGALSHAVGANKQQGSAYVFARDQGGADNWGKVKELTSSDGAASDGFGGAVSISGDTVVIGAYFDEVAANKLQGSAYVFERNQGGPDQWGEVKHLIASDGPANDAAFFGCSVAISGDTIIAGAQGNDVGATLNQGSAYVFQRDQGGAGNWGEVNKLTVPDGAFDDQLGAAVAISGGSIALGALFDQIGANKKQGSAYIFGCDCALNPPQITPATISREQGSPASVETIATVVDDLTPVGGLVVSVTSVPAGISVASITNTNGTITASIAVSCSAVLGPNLVGLKVTDSDNNAATGSLTINVTAETTPPTITCPTNITVVAAHPGDSSVVVNYPQPVVTDSCSVPTVVCNPPSGSAFPLGTTTVTCTATDGSNNTASCSFAVALFDICLQDDSNSGRVLLFNSSTGDYVFCGNGQKFIGKGSVTRKGSIFTLTHYAVDRRLQAMVDGTMNKGTASLQAPPGSLACSITDKDIRNNTCACSAP